MPLFPLALLLNRAVISPSVGQAHVGAGSPAALDVELIPELLPAAEVCLDGAEAVAAVVVVLPPDDDFRRKVSPG